MEELSPKEQAFVLAYLTNNYCASKAAVSAGYSERSKYDIGHELLRKPKIKAYINTYLKNESIEKLELIKRLSDVARNVASEYINPNGEVDLEQLKADGYGHVIRKTRQLKNGKVAVEFYSAERAQESLAKIHKLLSEGMSVTVNIDDHILAERELSEKLAQIEAKMMKDPIEKQVYEYRQQLYQEKQNAT